MDFGVFPMKRVLEEIADERERDVPGLGVPIAGAVLGATLGEGRAFKLRSQAQQLLVLVAIETNTRKAATPPAAPHVGP